MLRILVPLALALSGLGAGVGTAYVLRPTADPAAPSPGETADGGEGKPAAQQPAAARSRDTSEYVELGDQFVVPLVDQGTVSALIVLSVSVEVARGFEAEISAHGPRLRDLFLREMLNHATQGGFAGNFTGNGALDRLRAALRETGQKAMGNEFRDVLILGINRQEMF